MAHYVKIVQGAIAEAYNPSTRNKPNDGNWVEITYDMTPQFQSLVQTKKKYKRLKRKK